MKNNYNPYVVPEDFFVNTNEQAMRRFRNRRRAIRYGVAATMMAAALIVTPFFAKSHKYHIYEKEIVSNSLADMYEYDVFLQVNFTE